MKRYLSICLVMMIAILGACNIIPAENTATYTQTGISDTASQSGTINAENVEKDLRSIIGISSFVVEATLGDIQTVKVGDGTYLSIERDIYSFENIHVITGVYDKDTLLITMFQEEYNAFYQSADYQIGERYILIVQTTDSVNYRRLDEPERMDPMYMDSGILCKLDSMNHEIIDTMLVHGFPMTSMLGSKQNLINVIADEVGLQNTYYRANEQYVHSEEIEDIVNGADIVAKVHVNAVDRGDDLYLIEICDCTLLALYKGEISTITPSNRSFQIKPRRNSTVPGEEYLVLLHFRPDRDAYSQAAKTNSIIPMSDTDRVRQVYDALGISPEP